MRPGLAVVMTALVAEVASAGCAMTRAAQAPAAGAAARATTPVITGVGVEPKTLHPGGGVTIRYTLTQPATAHIDLVDEDGRVVRRLDAGRQGAGAQTLPWDGRTDEGTPVSGGVYRYIIHALDGAGHHAVHDPSPDHGGEELVPRDFTFDPLTGRMQWLMPRAGRARLRIGIQGFPHLRTLLDWEPLEAGRHELVWDGRDASGLIQAQTHPDLLVKLSAFALPDHTVIVHGEPASDAPERAGPVAYPPTQHSGAAYLHARHPRAVCHEARLSVEFPRGTRTDAQGRPRLSGTVPVRVVLDPHDAPHLVNQRFEVALYEDLTFLFEEEESVNPFTFLWETGRLTPGEHLLTVNILSYDDHYGVLTQPVVIEERP